MDKFQQALYKYSDTYESLSKLTKLADRFIKMVKANEWEQDPLYRSNPYDRESKRIQIEVTEEMDELIQDILSAVVLLRREFNDILKEKGKKSPVGELIVSIMEHLDRLESSMSDETTFNYYIESMKSPLSTAYRATSDIVNTLTNNGHILKYDMRNVAQWLNDIRDNIDKLHDLIIRQSDWLASRFRAQNLLEKVDIDVDHLTRDDLHIDYIIEDQDDLDVKQGDEPEQFDWRTTHLPPDDDTFEPDPELDYYFSDGFENEVKPGKTYHAR